MGTSTRDRVRAYRERQRQQGKARLSVLLDAEARAVLDILRTLYPGQSIDSLINWLITGVIPLPGNSSPAYPPLPGNGQSLPGNGQSLPGNGQSLPGNTPHDRAELATVGHRCRQEGKTLEAVAARFNKAGWTPAAIPRRAGTRSRADSSAQWTAKTVSQLLTRDYPNHD